MKTEREQFEKLPDIAKALNANGGGFYKELTNSYHHTNIYYDKFINGAWYAYQEQQRKIDSVLNSVAMLQYSSGDRIYNEVKELLK